MSDIAARLRECIRVGGIPRGIGLDILTQAADELDRQGSKLGAYRDALTACVAQLQSLTNYSTHWDGCEKEHNACLALKIAKEALND